jgi:hypothetical protein
MEDWPGHQQVLRGPEGLLQGPKLLVAEYGFERVELGVGAQHEHAVELGVLLGRTPAAVTVMQNVMFPMV